MLRISEPINFVRPDCPTIGENVHLVEQLAAKPQRLRLVFDIWLLPRVDCLAPLLILLQRRLCNLPRVLALGTEEPRIVAHPPAPPTELNQRQIPGKGHRYSLFLMRIERETDCNSTGNLFSAAGYIGTDIWQPPIGGKRLPNFLPHPQRIVGGQVRYFEPGAAFGCNGELPVPLIAYCSSSQP